MNGTGNTSGAQRADTAGNPVRLWALKTAMAFIILAASLLVPAGDRRWGMGWAYIVVLLAGQAWSGYILIRGDRGLLEERSRLHPGSKR